MARFDPSYNGIGQLLRSPEIRADLRKRVRSMRTYARSIAPVETGTYRRSFGARIESRRVKSRTRPVGVLYNDAPHALMVEYGTERTPRHATLRKALRASRD